MELPSSLFCIELAYSLDDRDVVERYLTEYPKETENCIHIALRQILDISHFFSKDELLKYLTPLWQNGDITDKLFTVANRGLVYLIPYFLNQGADIHAGNDQALRDASWNGHTETVKILLDRKADIHAGNDQALRNAAINGHTDVVKLLLDRKADIHTDHDYALRVAAMYGHTETVQLLLSRNANPPVLDDISF